MKKLFPIALALMVGSIVMLFAPAARSAGTNKVEFYLQQLVGTALDRTIISKPLGAPWFDGTNIIYGDPVTNRTTAGYAWTNLYAGAYTVSFSGLPGTVIIDVTNSAVPQSAAAIARRTPANSPAVRYYSASEVDALIRAATNAISSGSSTTNWFFANTNLPIELGCITNYSNNTVYEATNTTHLDTVTARSAALTIVSNQVVAIEPYVYKDVTNYSISYGSSTNVLTATPPPWLATTSARWISNYVVLPGFGYTNNSSLSQQKNSMKFDTGSSRWLFSLNGAQTIWATNIYQNTVLGVYRTNDTLGDYTTITYQRLIATTNFASYTVNRLRVFNVEDYGARGDGVPIYTYDLTNGVLTVPWPLFDSNWVGRVFYGFTDTNNFAPFLASVVNVNNSTNLTLDPSVQSLWITNKEAVAGYDNSDAYSDATAAVNSWGRGGVIHYSTGIYLHSKLTQQFGGGASNNYALLNIPEPLVNRNWNPPGGYEPTNPAVQIVIEGETEPVVFSQFIKSDLSTIGRAWGGTIIYAATIPKTDSDAIIRLERSGFNIYPLSTNKPWDDFAWNNVTLRNLTIRQKPLPSLHGFYNEWGGMPHVENVTLDVNFPPNFFDASGIPRFYPANGITNCIPGNSNLWVTNLSAYVNVTNPGGLKIGFRWARGWNYNGGLANNANAIGYGIGEWGGEHGKSQGSMAWNTIGGVAESSDYAEGYLRGSSSAWVKQASMWFLNGFPIVVSTNGTTHYVSFYSPIFENQALNWGTATITDPANKLGGSMLNVDGTDDFQADSTELIWNSLNSGVYNFGNNILLNIYSLTTSNLTFTGTLTGHVPGATNATNASFAVIASSSTNSQFATIAANSTNAQLATLASTATNALQLGGNAAANFLTNNEPSVVFGTMLSSNANGSALMQPTNTTCLLIGGDVYSPGSFRAGPSGTLAGQNVAVTNVNANNGTFTNLGTAGLTVSSNFATPSITSTGSRPTVTANKTAFALSVASNTVASTDMRGTIIFNTGASVAATSVILTNTFSAAMANTDYIVILTQGSNNTALLRPDTVAKTTTYFLLGHNGGETLLNQDYKWDYLIVK